MSRLQRESTTASVEQTQQQVAETAEYVPQHPLTGWTHVSIQAEADHLEQYTEVRPFEATEKNKNFFTKALDNGKGALKGAKDKVKKGLSKKKMKAAAKKVRKVLDVVEGKEKTVQKLRAKFKDKAAFDAAVKKKATRKEAEIYDELIN